MKSILQINKFCYMCGSSRNLESHHVMHGTANRKKAEEYGLKVWLCPTCHRTGPTAVHKNREYDLMLIRDGQTAFEDLYGHDEWMEVFDKNYL